MNPGREKANIWSSFILFPYSFFHFQLILMIFLNGKYHSPTILLRSNSCLLWKLIVLNFSKVAMENIRKFKILLLYYKILLLY